MIEAIKDYIWPKHVYKFDLVAPRTGERGEATVRARDEYAARMGVMIHVDCGYWIIGPAQDMGKA